MPGADVGAPAADAAAAAAAAAAAFDDDFALEAPDLFFSLVEALLALSAFG